MYSNMVRKDSGCSSSESRTKYAVKRIPRERSMYDSPLLYEVFNEITCLQLLVGNRGVSTYSPHRTYYSFGICSLPYFLLIFIFDMY